jgi:inositol-pentakisphosphate 2-kinase
MPSFIDAVVPIILGDPVFSMLGVLQRTFDSLDIEGLSQLWSRFQPGLPLGQGETEPTLAEWGRFVQTYLSGGEKTLRYNILAYLLSATFKDCSVILQLDGTGGAKNMLSIIDLDPKSVSRLSEWEALDRKIVENFADTLVAAADKGTVCIDAPPSVVLSRPGNSSDPRSKT